MELDLTQNYIALMDAIIQQAQIDVENINKPKTNSWANYKAWGIDGQYFLDSEYCKDMQYWIDEWVNRHKSETYRVCIN